MGDLILGLCSLDFQRVFFLTVASSTDLFGGCVQEGMFAGFGGWRKRNRGKDGFSHPRDT